MHGTKALDPARIGACSWSLRARSPAELALALGDIGVQSVQLALDPLRTSAWPEAETQRALAEAGIAVRSGMMAMHGEDYSSLESIRRTGGVVSDAHWPANRAAALENARLAQRLGLPLVSFHAGFLPHRGDRERDVILGRVRELVDVFAAHGVHTALETGQETAETLSSVLRDLDRTEVGVNFDPANMILYGMGDAVAALALLAAHVRQIHLKDARATRTPGTWGEEVAVGDGEVDWRAFFDVVRAREIACDFMIEREAGERRVSDMRLARERVASWLAGEGRSSRA